MSTYKNLMTVCCAAALALSLAACGGGGSSGPTASRTPTPTPEPEAPEGPSAEEQTAMANVIATALDAAKMTIAAGSTGAGEFTDPQQVSPVVMAMHDGTMATVSVTETGTPTGGSDARSGMFAKDEGPAMIAGWTGAKFMRGTAMEYLTVYTDVTAPTPSDFNTDNVQAVTGSTTDTVNTDRELSITLADHEDFISWIGAIPVVITTGTGSSAEHSFTGGFGGAMGTYGCTGAAATCTVGVGSDGKINLAGTWTFTADAAAMINVPDNDYLNFGWWLNKKADGSYDFQTFAGGTGFADASGNVAATMEGTAVYNGKAAGLYVVKDVSGGQVTGANHGEFTANATLNASFFGASDPGRISGTIHGFMNAAGESMAGWNVMLNPANLTDGSATFTGTTAGSLGAGTGMGSWEGMFHGSNGETGADARPTHVTGRFDAHFPGAHLAGAFGAK